MNKKLISWVSLFIVQMCLVTFGNTSEEEIKITLKADTPLFMAYVSPIENNGSSFSQEYLDALRNVLLFDFDNNGSTYIPGADIQKKIVTALSNKEAKECFPSDTLKNLGLAYLLQLKMNGKVLEPKLVQILSNGSRSITAVECTGKLDTDRTKLHELSSFIHKVLFNTPSVATCSLVWVCKHKKDTKDKEGKYSSEIFTSEYDGHNVRRITPLMDTLVTTPVWAPRIQPEYVPEQGRTYPKTPQAIVYVSYQLGQPKIFTTPVATFNPVRVSSMKGNQMTPAISLDGTKVAFACDTTGTSDLYMVDYNQVTGASSTPRQLFRAKGSATGCPAFSPDGKQIAFVSNKDGSPRIYVMDIPPISAKLKDIKPRLLTKHCSENTAPSWSPDGSKLAFSARSGKEGRQIWIYDFSSNKEFQLTSGEGDKESPSWAPNSQHLTFHSTLKDGTSSLFLISLRKPTPTCIMKGKDAFQFASWEPSIKESVQ